MNQSPFGKTIAIVLVVFLIFLFPLPYIAKAVNKTVKDLVNSSMTEFTDAARKKGKITKEMYENMIWELDRTGELYDIGIEVSHPVSGAEIKEAKLGDDVPDLKVARTSCFEILSEIDDCEEEQHEGHSHGDEIMSFATHTHSNDCYAGHRHTSSCNYEFNIPPEGIIGYFLKADGTIYRVYSTMELRENNGAVRLKLLDNHDTGVFTITEYRAGSVYYHKELTYGNGYYGDPLYIKTRLILYNSFHFVHNSFSNGMYENRGYNIVVFPGNIPQISVASCTQRQEETPSCSLVVTSITPTNPNQTVIKGSSIAATANATFLDGHTAIINCTSNYDPNQLGTQTVTLTYNGLIDNARTTGTKSCSVKVTVKEPFMLSSLTVSPAIQEVFRYQSPSFIVIANYDNGTSKPVTGYSISNYDSSILGTQPVTITYTEAGVTKTAKASVMVRKLTRACQVCNTGYYLDDKDIDAGCPYCRSTIVKITASPDNIILHKGQPLPIAVEAIYRNGDRSIVNGWTSDYDPSQLGIQNVTITYQALTASILLEVKNQPRTCNICSQEYEQRDDASDPGCPICRKTVVSINVTPKQLTINQHQALPIIVKAYYKDGHTESVKDWASNLTADTAGIYEVMILYQNVMDIITVTVMEEGQIECPYCGLKYIFNDSPRGCPSCYMTLCGIEASLRDGGRSVPYRSKLNLQIVKIFKDEHRELTYSGWLVSGYNPGQLGKQTITAHYNEFSDQFEIEVVDDLPEVICSNGHSYYMNADGSDPGCPYCSGTKKKEEALFYFDTTYTRFIMNAIYVKGEYPLKKGDYLKITIKPRNVSILSKLMKLFTGMPQIEYTFGGEVS